MKVLSIHTAALIALFLSAGTNAQDPYIRSTPIGTKEVELSHDPLICPYRTLTECAGEKFIFLPQASVLRSAGYMQFKSRTDPYGHPPYEECVGRIGIIESVSGEGIEKEIKLRMVDDNSIYVGQAYADWVMGIAPLRDIDSARTHWAGKKYWYRDYQLLTDPEGSGQHETIHLKRYQLVTIKEVVVGTDNFMPARLIVEIPDGREGYIDVPVSGTNGSRESAGAVFRVLFLETDPRVTHSWPKQIWSAIEDVAVVLNMTPEQVRMSWGPPESINQTLIEGKQLEQWVYGVGQYVYFDNGVVVSVQGTK